MYYWFYSYSFIPESFTNLYDFRNNVVSSNMNIFPLVEETKFLTDSLNVRYTSSHRKAGIKTTNLSFQSISKEEFESYKEYFESLH